MLFWQFGANLYVFLQEHEIYLQRANRQKKVLDIEFSFNETGPVGGDRERGGRGGGRGRGGRGRERGERGGRGGERGDRGERRGGGFGKVIFFDHCKNSRYFSMMT